MDEFTDTLNPENTTYSAFPARSDGSPLPYSANKITALALSANLLFVGSEKGVVTQYMIEEQETDCTCFMYTELMARSVSETAIDMMDCCISINLLVLLSDRMLTLCDAEQLERSGFNLPSRDVVTFNLRTWDASSAKLSFALASKRIHIYLLTNDASELIFETTIESLPKSLCLSTNFLGIVLPDRYLSVNLDDRTVTELLQLDPASVGSFMTVVEKDVFLVSGPGSLGVIVNATGTSQHNPIQMSPNVLQVFVWNDYIYTITDEFFTIHSLQSQTQIQTVLVNNATAACFNPDAMHFVFVSTWCPTSSPPTDLVAIGPERWDQFARKLILAGCLSEVRQLLIKQKRHMNALVEQRPASSKNEQTIFLKRSRRVFGLLGFYYFEQGIFTMAQNFFEKGVIDVRELLHRYEDLLPRGYTFHPDPFYQLTAIDHTSGPNQDGTVETDARSVTDLCLLHTLREASRTAKSSGDPTPNPAVTMAWATRYDRFLFDFLQKHHKSRFTETACHFLETALVKLYLRLSKRGIRPTLNELILPMDRLETSQLRMLSRDRPNLDTNAAHDLIQLISSLVHIDVDDLVMYLRHAEANHALALIYQWQGNLSAALDVWQKLAYGELKDEDFPGVAFYVAVLQSLTLPDAGSQTEYQQVAQTNVLPGGLSDHSIPSVYAELVWQHLCRALDAGKIKLCEQILSVIPVFSSFTCAPVLSDKDANSDPTLAPSQLLTPDNILNRISPEHSDLTRQYLRQLIYDHGDSNPSHHDKLAELYLNTIQKFFDSSAPVDTAQCDRLRLRREFCHFLRHSEYYSVDRLLQRMKLIGYQTLPFEAAILLGRSGQHKTALKILFTDLNDMSASMCYCLSFSRTYSCELGPNPVGLTGVCNSAKSGSGPYCSTTSADPASEVCENQGEAFTTLIELCLESKKPSDLELAVDLINLPGIPLDSIRILRLLPPELLLHQVRPFLTRALLSTQHDRATIQLNLGLAKRQAILVAETVQSGTESQPPRLIRSGAEQCASCHQLITLYGPASAFAWSARTDRCFHVHCWEQSHRIV